MCVCVCAFMCMCVCVCVCVCVCETNNIFFLCILLCIILGMETVQSKSPVLRLPQEVIQTNSFSALRRRRWKAAAAAGREMRARALEVRATVPATQLAKAHPPPVVDGYANANWRTQYIYIYIYIHTHTHTHTHTHSLSLSLSRSLSLSLPLSLSLLLAKAVVNTKEISNDVEVLLYIYKRAWGF